MKKSKKQSRKKTIIYFLERAKYYNNAGKYDKAVEKIKIAYSIWESYKNWESNKAQKMLNKIIDAKEIVIHNYLTVEERKIRAIIGD